MHVRNEHWKEDGEQVSERVVEYEGEEYRFVLDLDPDDHDGAIQEYDGDGRPPKEVRQHLAEETGEKLVGVPRDAVEPTADSEQA